MKRRLFVKGSVAASLAAGISPVLGSGSQKDKMEKETGREFYELRVYTLENASQQKLVEDYFQNAALPALNKFGIQNIGVFTEQQPEGQSKIYVLIPYKSVEDFISIADKLSNDAAYQQAGDTYLNAPAAEPAYQRIQSSFMRAFAAIPRLEVPPKKSRLFELRRYESASETAGKLKIKMFNDIGEIAIFRRVGLTPVFFGETLIGEMRPNLTYMLTFDDMAEHGKNWKAFGGDPEWNRIKAIPEYADAKIVSNITRTFLVPTAFSQI